jgi:hypothetical protein
MTQTIEEQNEQEPQPEVTLQDTYQMFYILVHQTQEMHPGKCLAFPLSLFKVLPKNLKMNFQQKDNKLHVWIPEKPSDRKKTGGKIIYPETLVINPFN